MLVRGHPTEPAPHRVSRLGWASVPVIHDGVWRMHSVPVDDLRGHLLAEGCPCGASEDLHADNVFVHNAFDGRENYERGRRRKH